MTTANNISRAWKEAKYFGQLPSIKVGDIVKYGKMVIQGRKKDGTAIWGNAEHIGIVVKVYKNGRGFRLDNGEAWNTFQV